MIVAIAAVGLLGLLAGVALGWYLRRTNDWCPACGEQLACDGCGAGAAWPRQRAMSPNQPAGRY